jgi:putative hydrolase of the HAD superfamily
MGISNIDVIVFDAMGVIFEEGDDTNNLLIPFIERECAYTDRLTIHHLYMEASLGHISSKEFWEQVGGDYPTIERRYLDTQLTLDPDLLPVAEQLKGRYTLAILSNDVSEWSVYLRHKFHLDRLFTISIISGDYGYRKPDPHLYDVLLKSLCVAPRRCIFIDDQPKNLLTAVRLGMKTILMSRVATAPPCNCDYEIHTLRGVITLL